MLSLWLQFISRCNQRLMPFRRNWTHLSHSVHPHLIPIKLYRTTWYYSWQHNYKCDSHITITVCKHVSCSKRNKCLNNAYVSTLFGDAYFFFLFLGCVPVSGEGEGHLAVSVHWGSQAKWARESWKCSSSSTAQLWAEPKAGQRQTEPYGKPVVSLAEVC